MKIKIDSISELALKLCVQDDFYELSALQVRSECITQEGFECVVAHLDSTKEVLPMPADEREERLEGTKTDGLDDTIIATILDGDFKHIHYFYIYTKIHVWGIVDIGYDVMALIAFPRNPTLEITL